ncbi:hypothetical protein SPFL3102_02696 [Sporomusaceae bacterium FL31]|nr:hypothetical protein SPFL3101_02671 [Sporomusaceae bacterium FL31]GCE34868.1 hypothetical protein SPFL3102_02696 [Sporomusaceae bacterium]
MIELQSAASSQLAIMKTKIKFVDWCMVCMSLLWLATIDFKHMTTLNWIAGGSIVGYMILYVIRRMMRK